MHGSSWTLEAKGLKGLLSVCLSVDALIRACR